MPQSQSPIIVATVQPGDPEYADVLPLFLMPASGAETAGLRRLGKALGPHWPLSLVCPPGAWDDTTPYSIEDAARVSAGVIRKAKPRIPFLVGGFCMGGVIAFETARLLQHEGCAGLLLFDTPVLGYPRLTPQSLKMGALARFICVLRDQWKQAGGRRRVLRFLVRKTVWYGMLVLRPVLVPLWRLRWVEQVIFNRLLSLPLFWSRRLDLPVLHILSESTGSNLFRSAARYDWETVAQQGVVYRSVPGAIDLIFSRPNLPVLSAAILQWSKDLQRTPEVRPLLRTCVSTSFRA